MTTIPMKTVVDCSTGISETVPFTAEELAQFELAQAEAEAERIARDEAIAARAALKASAKAKLIAGEPLTAEEADILIL